MSHVILFAYIVLITGGTGGFVALALLDSRIHTKLTRRFLIVHGALLASLFVALLAFYIDIIVPTLSGSGIFGFTIFRVVAGFTLGTIMYGATTAALVTLPGAPKKHLIGGTALVIVMMGVQGFFLLSGNMDGVNAGRIPHMVVISAFLLFVGYVMIRYGTFAPSPTMAWFVRRLGYLTGVFSLASTVLYLLIARIPFLSHIGISLDFIFYFLWSILAIAAFVRHMIRPVAVIEDTGVSEAFRSYYGITPREGEIIELIGQGLSNQEIADKLHVSFTTVRTHVYNIFKKCGAGSRVDLLRLVGGFRE